MLWVLLLALLGTTLSQSGLHTCSVPDVLRHYRAIIFRDLQAAVRRGAPGVEGTRPGSRRLHATQKNPPGASCGAQEEHSILLSIASLCRTMRQAVEAGRRGPLERAAWTVAVRTEAVMRRHCGMLRQHPRPWARAARRPGGRRRLLLRALDTVATCWEKLFALRAVVRPGPAPSVLRPPGN